MAEQAIEDFKRATENMSLPLILAMLARIHERLSEYPEKAVVADRVEQAIDLLLEGGNTEHGLEFADTASRSRRHH